MPYSLEPFKSIGLTEPLLRALLADHDRRRRPWLERLWAYYRNPAVGAPPAPDERPTLAQEAGLPPRLRGGRNAASDDRGSQREIVIENDIGWRIHALVDFMFGKPVSLVSGARDAAVRRGVERVLDAVFEASGGAQMLQDMALLAAVYGHVDLMLRPDALFDAADAARGSASPADPAAVEQAAELAPLARIELVEPRRATPLLHPDDYRRIDALIVRYSREVNEVETGSGAQGPGVRPLAAGAGAATRRDRRFLRGLLSGRAPAGLASAPRRRVREIVEVFSAEAWERYEDGVRIAGGENRLGVLPVAHLQNASQPFAYEGLSDVEPLIPLQDELNTRLSDRAHRVTMQSFQMYLGKGVEEFGERPVGPGQMWTTDNPDASVEAIPGDADAPSEQAHIAELREAMDKTSAVTPVASGVLGGRLGNLSSENALRVTMLGMLSKTQRKRVTYGRALAEMAALILRAFDEAGVLRTDPADRAVRVVWPDPLPRDERALLEAALHKRDLGVPRERLLAELGYAPGDAGVI